MMVLRSILTAAVLVAAAVQPPTVRDIDRQGYAEMLSAAKGRPLVVNMWATWCGPCRTEFPDLVRLHRDFGPRGLELVTVSMDMRSVLKTEVIPFLEEQGATFTFYIKSPGDDDGFINSVNPDWSGALPATFIYDSEGRLVKSIMKQTSYEQLEKAVTPLLEESN